MSKARVVITAIMVEKRTVAEVVAEYGVAREIHPVVTGDEFAGGGVGRAGRRLVVVGV
jgi:hypothetical protein